MKSKLIHKYLEIREARQWAALHNSLEASGLSIDLMRIDFILFNRYGFDISLTRKN